MRGKNISGQRKAIHAKINVYYKGKFLDTVVNREGRKGEVIISQDAKHSGFSAYRVPDSGDLNKTRYIGSSPHAESYTKRLAKQGYSNIKFLD